MPAESIAAGVRPADSKRGKPGSRIEWEQAAPQSGDFVTRTGVVWDRAPEPATVYAIPDELWPDEAAAVVYVGKAKYQRRQAYSITRTEQRRHVQLVDRFRRDCRLVAATQPYTAFQGGFKVQETRHRLHAIGCGCDLTGWSVSDPQRHEWLIEFARGVRTRPHNRPGLAECVMGMPE